jgi:3-isopropylmalate/(R)-2-methylmalate dehydratase small subunit
MSGAADGHDGDGGGVPGPDRGAPVVGASGPGVAVRGDDVDTDQIVPARFLKEVTFDDMAEYAFHDERAARDDHPFDRPEHADARVLVVNDNFGCGSSREHAPQALLRWGIRAIVGESFAEIFADNCTSLGIPTVTADPATVEDLQAFVEAHPDRTVEVDLDGERVAFGDRTASVGVDPSAKEALVAGNWDTTAVMRTNMDRVRETASSLPYATAADAGDRGDGTGSASGTEVSE